MKTFRLYPILLLTVIFSLENLHGQNSDDGVIIKNVYKLLQDKNNSPKDITALMPGIKWNESQILQGDDDRQTITLNAIVKNDWQGILFEDLYFDFTKENKVEVTGKVNGRQLSECDYITTRFKHSWTLKNGKIIAFKE